MRLCTVCMSITILVSNLSVCSLRVGYRVKGIISFRISAGWVKLAWWGGHVLLMLVLHLIIIASHSAGDKPVPIEVLLLLVSTELEWDAVFGVGKASVSVLIVHLLVVGSCLALSKAGEIPIICWVFKGYFGFCEVEPLVLWAFSH